MNDTMNKTFGEQSGSAKSHLDTVQILAKDIFTIHQGFSEDITNLVGEMGNLKEKVKKNSHELRKFFTERISTAQDLLVVSHESQLSENKSMQQTMTEIKRQNRETTEAIAKAFDKIKKLDITVDSLLYFGH